jgi:hypothetical protein
MTYAMDIGSMVSHGRIVDVSKRVTVIFLDHMIESTELFRDIFQLSMYTVVV